jgi:hypothetical protein
LGATVAGFGVMVGVVGFGLTVTVALPLFAVQPAELESEAEVIE